MNTNNSTNVHYWNREVSVLPDGMSWRPPCLANIGFWGMVQLSPAAALMLDDLQPENTFF
jgi:hypothetical protein